MTLEYQQRIIKFHEICIFDALKVQALSDLTWKRSVHCNPPPKGKCRARGDSGKRSCEPKSITASQRSRVKEFPEECLAVTGAGKSKLFCKAFREELSLNKNCLSRVIREAQNLETDCFVQCHILGFFNYCFDIVLQQE